MSQVKKRISRRGFLKALGAAGVAAGCSGHREAEKLVPFLNPQEYGIPGKALFYRSICRECGAGCGVTARAIDGRVVKLEGNPEDPIGRGALCARGQAAVQLVYAPDRFRGPMRRKAGGPGPDHVEIPWKDAIAEVATAIGAAKGKGPDRVRMITRPEPGVAGDAQRAFLQALGAAPADRVVLDPFDPAPIRAAAATVFGRPEIPVVDLSGARTVVSFGADIGEGRPSPIELARGFAEGRGKPAPERARFIWIAPRLSATGACADSWLRVRPGTEPIAALGLLSWLVDPANGVAGSAGGPEGSAGGPAGAIGTAVSAARIDPAEAERRCGLDPGALSALGAELAARRPSALIGPGIASTGSGAAQLATAVQLANVVLGNVGKTVLYGLDPLADPPSPSGALQSLAGDMSAGNVDVLLVHHVDPVSDLPASFGFAEALDRVPLVVSFSDRLDGTTRRAHIVLPDNHPLETFEVMSPRHGVDLIAQAAMSPLWSTHDAGQSLIDIAAKLPAGTATPLPFKDYRAVVEDRMSRLFPGGNGAGEGARLAAERGGVFAGAAPAPGLAAAPAPGLAPAAAPGLAPVSAATPALAPAEQELSGDGAFAVIPFPAFLGTGGDDRDDWSWLREVPDPMTTISWSDWVEIAPAAAARLGLTDGDVVAISSPAGKAELPAYVTPAIRDDAIGIPYGSAALRTLLPVRIDPASGAFARLAVRASLARTGRHSRLTRLEGSPYQHGREIARSVSASSPAIAPPPPVRAMYQPPAHPVHRWAMAIDQDRCIACGACVVACYAENNVPVNGPALGRQGRNMEWLRIERYLGDERGGPLRVEFLLMLCQHCTSAPCEPVCPVYATYHTSEGLNAQVYNRCVGTRYCSNNCPYKVRTFNWRDPPFPEPLNMQLNPDVTVRSKGVMEKCTFCAQRIRTAEIAAESEGRQLRDGEFTTACAQTCPTGAIAFGDANDPASRVSRLSRDVRAYRVLEEINTRPAITYLARMRDERAAAGGGTRGARPGGRDGGGPGAGG